MEELKEIAKTPFGQVGLLSFLCFYASYCSDISTFVLQTLVESHKLCFLLVCEGAEPGAGQSRRDIEISPEEAAVFVCHRRSTEVD